MVEAVVGGGDIRSNRDIRLIVGKIDHDFLVIAREQQFIGTHGGDQIRGTLSDLLPVEVINDLHRVHGGQAMGSQECILGHRPVGGGFRVGGRTPREGEGKGGGCDRCSFHVNLLGSW